eukprot:COSAG03_NODE_119_length_12315_cov_126.503847_3_plen_386_part_00
MTKKAKKQRQRKAKSKQTVDLTLRLNVELGQKRGTSTKQRVKRIIPRRRQNLREMRLGMMTQAQAQTNTQQSLFASPAFYGNVKMLNDAALNQFQNQRYSLEQQVREASAEQQAMLAAGRADAAEKATQVLAAQTKQLADLQQRFGFQSTQLAAVAGQAGLQIGQQQEKTRSAQEQLAQVATEEQARADRSAAASSIPQGQLRSKLIPLLNERYGDGHFAQQHISDHMLRTYESDIRAFIAGDQEAGSKVLARFDKTKRGREGLVESTGPQQAPPSPTAEIFDLEVSDRPLGGFSGDVTTRTFEAETPASIIRKRREIGAPQKGPIRNPVGDYDSDSEESELETDEEDLLSPATRKALDEQERGTNVDNPLWDVSGIDDFQDEEL